MINKNEELKNIFSIIFPELKYISRLEKLNLMPSEFQLNKLQILSVLLIENSNNIEYFCHKYNVSNDFKNGLSEIFKSYEHFLEDKDFFKSKIKKNIYYFGKNNLKELNLLIFFMSSKVNYEEDFLENSKKIEKISIPKFPYDGAYFLKKGLSEGKKLGEALAELEKDWIENNFSIKDKDVTKIIDKYKA